MLRITMFGGGKLRLRGAVDAFRKIAAALARGYVAFGKQLLVRELYGDDAYARFLCKRALGGEPLPRLYSAR